MSLGDKKKGVGENQTTNKKGECDSGIFAFIEVLLPDLM